MIFKQINKNEFTVFVNSNFESRGLNSKGEEEDFFKKLVNKIGKKYNFSGIYNVFVYPVYKVGIFMDFIKEEDLLYNNYFDFKLNIKYDNFYFCTDDYFVIKDYNNIYFYNNKYYVKYDNISIIKCCEFGDFICENSINKIFNKFIKIK